eukprot:Hpha_TRINITY_DN16778_c4_g6::TRINITY_DN16778_c4_g6_i1::g.77581::m.77581
MAAVLSPHNRDKPKPRLHRSIRKVGTSEAQPGIPEYLANTDPHLRRWISDVRKGRPMRGDEWEKAPSGRTDPRGLRRTLGLTPCVRGVTEKMGGEALLPPRDGLAECREEAFAASPVRSLIGLRWTRPRGERPRPQTTSPPGSPPSGPHVLKAAEAISAWAASGSPPPVLARRLEKGRTEWEEEDGSSAAAALDVSSVTLPSFSRSPAASVRRTASSKRRRAPRSSADWGQYRSPLSVSQQQERDEQSALQQSRRRRRKQRPDAVNTAPSPATPATPDPD